MTEREWLEGTQSWPMVQWLTGQASARKFRLFVVEVCRSMQDELTSDVFRQTVDFIERLAEDGITDVAEVDRMRETAQDESYRLWGLVENTSGGWGASLYLQTRALSAAAGAALHAQVDPKSWLGYWDIQQEYQCHLLRDIFRGPRGPHPLVEPDWLAWSGGLIRHMAQQMYQERRFDDLPVLADALEEAGCTSQWLLAHLRSPGPHVRGCWAVDLILDKR